MTALLTDSEIRTALELAQYDRPSDAAGQDEDESDRLPPGSGIIIGVLFGLAIWTAIGIILYFTFSGG